MKELLLKVKEFLIKIINCSIIKLLFPTPKILSVEESIISIIKNKKSVC